MDRDDVQVAGLMLCLNSPVVVGVALIRPWLSAVALLAVPASVGLGKMLR